MTEKKSKTKKAVLFIHGNENSRKAQLERLKSYCDTHNLDIIKTFECDGKNLNYHTVFNEMVKYVKGKKSKMAIVTYSISHLQTGYDQFIYLDKLRTKKDSEIHFFKENFVIHKYSSQNDISRWDMYILATKFYRNSLQDKIKRTFDFKYHNGIYPHLAPIGYKNVRDSANRANIIIDTKEASVIMKLFRAYATEQYSMKSVTALAHRLGLTNRHGKLVSQTCVNNILKNPFYYGEMFIKGRLLPHKYDTFIEKSLFQAVQAVIKSRKSANHLKNQ